MTIQTIIFLTLALLISLGFSFFMYLFRKDSLKRKDYIFFVLRAIAIFLILLLLINPKISSTEYELEKPELVLLVDNSESISFLGAEREAKQLISEVSNSEEILKNFDLMIIPFGETISVADSLDFTETNSDMYRALEESYNLSNTSTAVVFLSDGNQNIGRDFKYFKTPENSKVFPVILGDTTKYPDLRIDQINVNRYAFLNNKFPVEVFASYSGEDSKTARISIKNGSQVIFSQSLEFSNDENSKILNAEIPASSVGIKNYTVEIEVLENEKNTNNNRLNFAIEVIDERTAVLILSEISHPDLGAFKKSIESNKQRIADIEYIDNEITQLEDYQLIIVYQPNQRFKQIFDELDSNNSNYLLVTGSETDWNFVNQLQLGIQRNATNQTQDIFPEVNENFGSYQFQDIDFNDFPPLVDLFGPLEYEQDKFDVLLFQKIQGVETDEPLLAIIRNGPKSGFLLGENIWRWRAKSFIDTKSFENFDEFVGKLVQNLSSGQRRERLTVAAENFYYGNQDVIIKAEYFDQNYQFDPNASLYVNIIDSSKVTTINSELVNTNNYYQVNAGNLPAGNYVYTVDVQDDNINKTGAFQVIDYNIEEQQTSANLQAMQDFASYNKSQLYYPDNLPELLEDLFRDESLKPIQKSREKTVPLIDWYYLLFILIFILAAEWFYRKYLGLI